MVLWQLAGDSGFFMECCLVQIEGNEMEFMAYGLLYAAVTNPKQLAMELRGIPTEPWNTPT